MVNGNDLLEHIEKCEDCRILDKCRDLIERSKFDCEATLKRILEEQTICMNEID